MVYSDVVGSSNFAIDSDACSGQTLNPGASCQAQVQFVPQAAGPLTDTLTFADNSLNVVGRRSSSR